MERLHADQALVGSYRAAASTPERRWPKRRDANCSRRLTSNFDPSTLGASSWRREVTFRHAGTRRVQTELVVRVRLAISAPAIDPTGQLADEVGTFLGSRWWTVGEIEASKERFCPRRLPQVLRRFLDGEPIDEPFEHFS